MEIILYWEKLLFSGNYQLSAKDKQVGSFRFKRLSRASVGELMGIKVRFEADGFFRKKTYMFYGDDAKAFGVINHDRGLLTNAATVRYNENSYEWNFKNPVSSKWEVKDGTSVRIKSKTTSLKGKMKISQPEAPLILASLYVSRYYKDSNANILTVILAGSAVFQFLRGFLG
jgi:hypothetical protein